MDYETTNTYNLEVIAMDGGAPSLTSTTTVTVSVTNVNENPPTCQSYNLIASISEDAAVNNPVSKNTYQYLRQIA